MITLLADANIEGQIAYLVARMRGEEWLEFWDSLGLRLAKLADVGLETTDADNVVWQKCQQHELLLLTDNRNAKGPDSLEATIRSHNTSQSLPVFTIGDSRRILSDSAYSDRIIDRLFRYLLELESIRGTGRLYLP